MQDLQSQLDEVRTERDKLEQARAEMEADREEEIKIIERVNAVTFYDGMNPNCKLYHRMCSLEKMKLVQGRQT